jgi:hypothetical protein
LSGNAVEDYGEFKTWDLQRQSHTIIPKTAEDSSL